MREDIYKFELTREARVDTSGSLLIVDPVCLKDVKCDWFKRFAPKSPYDLASTKGALDVLRNGLNFPDERESPVVGTEITRDVARVQNKVLHYLDLSERIEGAGEHVGFLAPPHLLQGQHGVYFRTGRSEYSYQVVEEKNGYAIVFSEVPHPNIYSELPVKSGMIMIIDGKEDLKVERGVDKSALSRIAVPKGTYDCSFSKDGMKIRIKRA